MTAIIAAKSDDAIYMAADTVTVFGDYMRMPKDKIRLRGKWWHAGDNYAVLDQIWDQHAQECFEEDEAPVLCERLRALLKDNGWGKRDDDDPFDGTGGTFLLARRGQLWHVDSLLYAIQIPDDMPVCCGSGTNPMISAYRTARLCDRTVEEAVRLACGIACDLESTCNRPISLLRLGDDGKLDKETIK